MDERSRSLNTPNSIDSSKEESIDMKIIEALQSLINELSGTISDIQLAQLRDIFEQLKQVK